MSPATSVQKTSVSGDRQHTARPTPAAARGPSAEPRPSSLRAARREILRFWGSSPSVAVVDVRPRNALTSRSAAPPSPRPRRPRFESDLVGLDPCWWRGRRPDMSPEAHRRHRCRGAARRPTVGRELGASNPVAPHRFPPPRRASTRALVSRAPQAATGASAPSAPRENPVRPRRPVHGRARLIRPRAAASSGGPHSNSERGRPDRRIIAFSVPARNSSWSGTGMVTVPTLPVFCITTWLPRILTSPKP